MENEFDKKTIDSVAKIDMTVNDDSSFLSPYSETGKPVISSEVAGFLENAATAFHPKEKITLTVHSTCIDDNEKEIYDRAIRNYFKLQLNDVKRDMRRKTVIATWFSTVGVFALAFMFLIGRLGVNDLWVECVDIFAWVFLWEAVDQFFIERSGLMLRKKRLDNFIDMKIIFDK